MAIEMLRKLSSVRKRGLFEIELNYLLVLHPRPPVPLVFPRIYIG